MCAVNCRILQWGAPRSSIKIFSDQGLQTCNFLRFYSFTKSKIITYWYRTKRDGGWLLFHYLAYLANLSINDFINLDFCSVTYQYASFDDVLSMICSIGKKCQSAKMDVKSVFRLLPVHLDDYQLLDF